MTCPTSHGMIHHVAELSCVVTLAASERQGDRVKKQTNMYTFRDFQMYFVYWAFSCPACWFFFVCLFVFFAVRKNSVLSSFSSFIFSQLELQGSPEWWDICIYRGVKIRTLYRMITYCTFFLLLGLVVKDLNHTGMINVLMRIRQKDTGNKEPWKTDKLSLKDTFLELGGVVLLLAIICFLFFFNQNKLYSIAGHFCGVRGGRESDGPPPLPLPSGHAGSCWRHLHHRGRLRREQANSGGWSWVSVFVCMFENSCLFVYLEILCIL